MIQLQSFKSLKVVISAIVALGIALSIIGALGLTKDPPAYKPSELQLARLQVKQKDAQIAQVRLQDAQQRFQAALAELDKEAGAVKEANKWPSNVQFNPDTLSFEVPKLPPGQPDPSKPPNNAPVGTPASQRPK